MSDSHGSDVIVVGGGVIGCSIAFWLTELGLRDVVLVEKGVLAGGATGICPGGIRQQFEGEADCIIARHSVHFYQNIAERLDAEHPFPFERSGYLFAAHCAETLEQYRRNVATQNRLGIPSRMLDDEDVRGMLPALSRDGLLGASFCGEDGFLEDCHGVTFALARAARRRGLRIVQHVEALAVRRAAPRWQVETTAGVFEAPHVVLAAGVGSVALAQTVGLELPITEVRRRLVFTARAPTGQLNPLLVAVDRSVAAKQLRSGVFYLGWLGESEEDDDLTFTEQALTSASLLLPLFTDLAVHRIVRGSYDLSPDRRPVLGPATAFPGLHLAVGFSGHGFMIAPAVGEMVASLLCGIECGLPTEPFSLERFARPSAAESLYV